MKQVIHFLKTHGFTILLIGVVVLAILLRFYNYLNRWGLAYDQAHDVIIARYALSAHKLPLLGPFSSAGPFQTGGEWYWFIMLGALLIPFTIAGPWIFLTLIQVCFVLLMAYVGYKLVGKWYGLILGFLSAISPAGISQSINLTNQSILNVISAGAIVFALLYLRSRKTAYLFWLGFFATLGATVHLQGVPLVGLAVGVVLLDRMRNKKGLLLIIAGGLLPLLPLIYVDFTNHFFNVKNMMQYYFHDQYKISLNVLGRRWQTYLSTLWPQLWGDTIGGNKLIGLGIMVGGFGLIVWSVYKKLLTKQWILLIGVFLFAFTLIRYTRTPIFDSYIMFLHPFVFIFTGILCYTVLKKQWVIGALLLLVISFYSIKLDYAQIKNGTNFTAYSATSWEQIITTKYSQKTFALYDYKYRFTGSTFPFLMYLQYNNHVGDLGHKIGLGFPSNKDSMDDVLAYNSYANLIIRENRVAFTLLDLQSSSAAELKSGHWELITPKSIYDATQYWYTKKQ